MAWPHGFGLRVPAGGVWGPRPQAGRFQEPGPSFSAPAVQEIALLALLSSKPDTVREAKCLLGTLVSRRAAGTGREDPQPDKNPSQFWLL